MVRQTKSKTTESGEVVTPVAPVAPVEVAPKEKKVKVAKAAKVEAAPVVPETVVSSEEPVVAEEAPLAELSLEFAAKIQQVALTLSALKSDFRALDKKWAREIKAAQKQSTKHKRKAGNRAPSGFVKPTRISDELAKFLDKPSGTEMARTDVTRDVNKYIRANNLQDKENGRKINPDPKLATLLKLKKTDELTYFNLQKYMSHHFAKATNDAPVVATA